MTEATARHGFHGSTIAAFCFSPSAGAAADAILDADAAEIFHILLRDQESEGALLAAKRVVDATLADRSLDASADDLARRMAAPDGSLVLERMVAEQAGIARDAAKALAHGEEARRRALRERAPIALLAGCWLDTVSQPATQPAEIVNLLFAQYWRLAGEGSRRRGTAIRGEALARSGVLLPPVGHEAFARESGMSAWTALYAAFLVALSRFSANLLPEVIGVHYAYHALALDDRLAGTAPVITEPEARGVLLAYLEIVRKAGAADVVARVARAAALVIALEARHAAMLAAIAETCAARTLDDKVAEIIRRHAPFAGKQHGAVRVGGKLLAELFTDPQLDLQAFLRAFKRSPYLRPDAAGHCRFTDAMRFGGPMFGIFSEEEAAIFRAWAATAPAKSEGDAPATPSSCSAAESDATAWLERVRRAAPHGVVFAEAATDLDDRTLLYRLVNVENFSNLLAVASARVEAALARTVALFESGAHARYTDASFFRYTPRDLLRRVRSIYWEKLVGPYAPLAEVPPRDEVIFNQKTFALGSLVDGSWAFRIGKTGHRDRLSDHLLFEIYADEMGRGDPEKNHITLIYRVLESLGIAVPHIRDESFIDQDEIPDTFYAFPLNQLCLGLFPDRFYPEILGYNLGIEMFGLGELRLHEIQKLRRWGFDPIYEQVHLTIDNFSAGHAQQSVTAVMAHLDDVERECGADAAQAQWKRVWNGYALFAWFAEGGDAANGGAAASGNGGDAALVI